ncbi:MAG: hypothetical protein ABIK38_03195 [candidate division WOR-3 bacterium]
MQAKYFIIFTLLATLNLFTTGCPKKGPATLPDTSATQPAFKFQSLLGAIYQGEVDGVDLTGLPKKLLYPGARPLARFGKYERPRWGCSYNFETPDKAEKVLKYFQELLKEWEIVQRFEKETYTMLVFRAPGDKEVVELTVTPKEGRTVIVIGHTYN